MKIFRTEYKILALFFLKKMLYFLGFWTLFLYSFLRNKVLDFKEHPKYHKTTLRVRKIKLWVRARIIDFKIFILELLDNFKVLKNLHESYTIRFFFYIILLYSFICLSLFALNYYFDWKLEVPSFEDKNTNVIFYDVVIATSTLILSIYFASLSFVGQKAHLDSRVRSIIIKEKRGYLFCISLSFLIAISLIFRFLSTFFDVNNILFATLCFLFLSTLR